MFGQSEPRHWNDLLVYPALGGRSDVTFFNQFAVSLGVLPIHQVESGLDSWVDWLATIVCQSAAVTYEFTHLRRVHEARKSMKVGLDVSRYLRFEVIAAYQ